MAAFNISQTNEGADFSVSVDEIDISRLTVPAAGRITAITFYAAVAGLQGQPVIYASTGTFGTVGSRLWYGSEMTIGSSASATVTANLDFVGAQEIFVGIHAKVNGATRGWNRSLYDKDGSGTLVDPAYYENAAYGTPPAGPIVGTQYTRALALRVLFSPTVSTDRTMIGDTLLDAATGTNYTVAANGLELRRVVFAGSTTINKIRVWATGYSAHASVKALIYGDTAGSPGARLAVGSVRAGLYPGGNDLVFASDQVLSAGTYWIGFVSDVSWIAEAIAGTVGAVTKRVAAGGYYASPPNPAPATAAASDTLTVAISTGAALSVRRRTGVCLPC